MCDSWVNSVVPVHLGCMKPVINSGMNYQHWFNWCPNESLVIIHTHVGFKQDNRDDHSPFNRCKVSCDLQAVTILNYCELMGENFPGLALSQRISFPKLRFLVVGWWLTILDNISKWESPSDWGFLAQAALLSIHINHQLPTIILKHCKWAVFEKKGLPPRNKNPNQAKIKYLDLNLHPWCNRGK